MSNEKHDDQQIIFLLNSTSNEGKGKENHYSKTQFLNGSTEARQTLTESFWFKEVIIAKKSEPSICFAHFPEFCQIAQVEKTKVKATKYFPMI